MFIRDIADISWEIFRHRRAIASVYAISFDEALVSVIEQALPSRVAKIKSKLAKYGVSLDAIVAKSYSINRETLDKLHRLLALAEARRTAITRNLNEYRAMASLSEKPAVDPKEIALVPSSA